MTKIRKSMDVFDFYKDDNKKSSGSSDLEHLIYGAGCTYFLTGDNKLYHRAKQIYKFLNTPTECILFPLEKN